MADIDSREDPPESKTDIPSDTPLKKLKKNRLIAGVCFIVVAVGVALKNVNTVIEEGGKLWAYMHSRPPAAFDAKIGTVVDLGPLFWVVKENQTVCPAPVGLFLDITNLQNFRVMIDDFRVDALDADEKWVTLPHVIIYPGSHLYQNPNPSRATLVETDLIDQMVENFNLEPHTPLRGWAFFERPFDYPFTRFRVTLSDALGTVYTTAPLTVGGGKSLQMAKLTTVQGTISDLTTHTINYHCGL